ncbi:MAG: hypothetical protein IKX53_03030 [Bacteroidales bacterium]|nr:hypothetical protein [Bacteroidales bacterium]
MLSQVHYYVLKYRWWIHDIQDIRQKIRLSGAEPLSQSEKKEIQAFWKPLVGKKVPVYWHQYFKARNGFFSARYVPTAVYHYDMIFHLNYRPLLKAYANKAFYDTLFPDVRRPRTVIKRMNGFYYDDKHPLTQEEAFERCWTRKDLVVKPALDGMWGRGVRIFSTNNGRVGEESLSSLLEPYGLNFVVQEKVVQHERMSALNPTSLNTIRVLSYRHGNEIVIMYAVVRIGRKGQLVDNETAGGINADIDLTTGRIRDCAYGTPAEKKILRTDVGTELKGFSIPSFDAIIRLVKELHLNLPYFKLVGWDIGIDNEGQPVMIEFNRAPDLSQTAHGPAFGDLTEEIVQDARHGFDSYKIIF